MLPQASSRCSRTNISACSGCRARQRYSCRVPPRKREPRWRWPVGKPTGFVEIEREVTGRRPVAERVNDWNEIDRRSPKRSVQAQGARCMDCGVPFCHTGLSGGQHHPGLERPGLSRPTGRRRCAFCTPPTISRSSPGASARRRARASACSASTSRRSRSSTSRRRSSTAASRRAGSSRSRPQTRTGKSVAVVGSGPAGLAAAQQLNRAGPSGHGVREGRSHRRPAALRHP